MELPPQVQKLVDAIGGLPGVAACFCGPKPLMEIEAEHLSLPGEFGDLPQVPIRRTNGGLEGEVMIQTEVIFDRSPEAWLSLEFLAWWVRDWARSGHQIQMRPTALPPKGFEIQLGRTLKFLVEYFVIEPEDSYETTLTTALEMGESIEQNFADYRECFEAPAEFENDVESI